MATWEFCQLSNPGSGTDSVQFSHQQGATMVDEASKYLGRGLKAKFSNASFLHLNLNRTSAVIVAGMLGGWGWELVTHSTLTGGHEYWTFRRELVTEDGS